MNVLVIAPHPDDESIGCGGTLCKHARGGDHVIVVYLTSGELGLKHLPRDEAWEIREKEARSAGKMLGFSEIIFLRGPDWCVADAAERLSSELKAVFRETRPALVYLPHALEWHPDHKAALPIVRASIRSSGIEEPTLRGYEIWTPLSEFDHVEDITSVMLVKLRAVRAHRSQCKQLPYDRAVRGLNEYRGALAAKSRYAEVFQVIRPGS